MTAINAKAIRYIDCTTCGAERGFPCHVIRAKDSISPEEEYSGTWFVHHARREPFETEFWRGVRYQANLSLKSKDAMLL